MRVDRKNKILMDFGHDQLKALLPLFAEKTGCETGILTGRDPISTSGQYSSFCVYAFCGFVNNNTSMSIADFSKSLRSIDNSSPCRRHYFNLRRRCLTHWDMVNSDKKYKAFFMMASNAVYQSITKPEKSHK